MYCIGDLACRRDVHEACVCDVLVDGIQQCVKLNDSVHGSDVAVAELTIAFTGTSFDMDKFPDRTTHNGITNGDLC